MNHESCNNRGQSLIEVVIALGVFGIIMSAGLVLFFGGRSLTADSLDAERALEKARTGIEAVRIMRDRNWNDLTNGNHGLAFSGNAWSFNGTSDTAAGFTRQIAVSDAGTDIKKVKITVAWHNDSRTQSIDLTEFITNWQNKQSGNGDPFGDWANPRTLSSIDAGPAVAGSDVDAEGTIAYLTTTSSNASKPDLYIYDISNPSSPILKSQTDILGSSGLVAIDHGNGHYLYGVLQGLVNDFVILDVSDPTAPAVIKSMNINQSAGTNIAQLGNRVYFSTKNNSSGPEFYIIDVTNPSNPSIIGSYEAGADINDFFVLNERAYLATSRTSGSLITLNVSDASAIQVLGTAYNNPIDSVFVKSWAQTFVSIGQELKIIDTTTPANPVQIGSYNPGSTVNDIYAIGPLAFLATNNSNQEFQTVLISNPSSPVLWSYFNFPQVANAIDYYNNLVFTAVRSNDALRIITSTQ